MLSDGAVYYICNNSIWKYQLRWEPSIWCFFNLINPLWKHELTKRQGFLHCIWTQLLMSQEWWSNLPLMSSDISGWAEILASGRFKAAWSLCSCSIVNHMYWLHHHTCQDFGVMQQLSGGVQFDLLWCSSAKHPTAAVTELICYKNVSSQERHLHLLHQFP